MSFDVVELIQGWERGACAKSTVFRYSRPNVSLPVRELMPEQDLMREEAWAGVVVLPPVVRVLSVMALIEVERSFLKRACAHSLPQIDYLQRKDASMNLRPERQTWSC